MVIFFWRISGNLLDQTARTLNLKVVVKHTSLPGSWEKGFVLQTYSGGFQKYKLV